MSMEPTNYPESGLSQLRLEDPVPQFTAKGWLRRRQGLETWGARVPRPRSLGRWASPDAPPPRKSSGAGLSPPRRPQGSWPDARAETQPAPHILFHLGSLLAPLPSKILAAGMKGRGRERGAAAPPECVPTGVDLGAEGDSPAAGPNETDYNPHTTPRQGRDPIMTSHLKTGTGTNR